jgi:hypothetical protein
VCDATVVALNLFRVEIAEPLLRLITPEEPVLSPMLLAALLSIVVSTRGKLIALGFRSVRPTFMQDPGKTDRISAGAKRSLPSTRKVPPSIPRISRTSQYPQMD